MRLTTDKLREQLEQIAYAHGGLLRPEDVVSAARRPDHPLHDRFEWDDAAAAEAHRVEQARTLIRSVRVEVKTITHEVSVVHYIPDPDQPQGGGYLPVNVVAGDRARAAQAVALEFGRAASALRRARDIALALGEAASVEVESALETVEIAAGKVGRLRMVG